jgi:hypothetical protein
MSCSRQLLRKYDATAQNVRLHIPLYPEGRTPITNIKISSGSNLLSRGFSSGKQISLPNNLTAPTLQDERNFVYGDNKPARENWSHGRYRVSCLGKFIYSQ